MIELIHGKNVRVGVGVFVVKNDKFLVQKRIGAHGANTWAPPGGHMEFGETWEQTTVREVHEETGLNVSNVLFVGLTNDFFANEMGGVNTTLLFGRCVITRKASQKLLSPKNVLNCVGWI